MSGTEPLRADPRELALQIADAHRETPGWLDEFSAALDGRRAGEQLGRFLGVWRVSQSEAARLFGVTRQAVSKWLARGVPSSRSVAVADLASATDLLVRYLERDRVPSVVRRPAAALGGLSLLDLVGLGRTRDVLEACQEMFDFSRAHR